MARGAPIWSINPGKRKQFLACTSRGDADQYVDDMRFSLALLRSLLLVLLVACAGCGSGERRLDEARVTTAFQDAGLHRPSALIQLFNGHLPGTDVKEQSWGSESNSMSPSVEVELFSSIAQARQVMTIGGNIETAKGMQIPPLARVANVVVTLEPDASREERSRALRAVASLRQGSRP
jgi:hypothetical protein